MLSTKNVAREFDLLRHGFTMRGWDFTRKEIAEAIAKRRMLNPAMELGTNHCPWNCSFCFTEDPTNPEGSKRRLQNELTLEERLRLIDQAAELGARSINFVGAGEPTIDPYFFELLERMAARNIVPIVYTEGTLRFTDPAFAKRVFDLGATVVLKMNSRENEEYQNAVVAGPAGRKAPRAENYFRERQKAIDVLFDTGFANPTPTRFAFDTIICQENREEIPRLHRWARKHNVFVLFVNYLPSGRSADGLHGMLTRKEQFNIFAELARIDEKDFGLKHRSIFPYAGGTPCTIRGLGLYVKIRGEAFDCPGEHRAIGNVRQMSLAEIWEGLKRETANFDGGCEPREDWWRRNAKTERRLLPIIG